MSKFFVKYFLIFNNIKKLKYFIIFTLLQFEHLHFQGLVDYYQYFSEIEDIIMGLE